MTCELHHPYLHGPWQTRRCPLPTLSPSCASPRAEKSQPGTQPLERLTLKEGRGPGGCGCRCTGRSTQASSHTVTGSLPPPSISMTTTGGFTQHSLGCLYHLVVHSGSVPSSECLTALKSREGMHSSVSNNPGFHGDMCVCCQHQGPPYS